MTAGRSDTAETVSVPAERDRLTPLFAPRGIVVIGASRDPTKLGAAMARSLSGSPGPVAGINPRDVDAGERRFANVADAAVALSAPQSPVPTDAQVRELLDRAALDEDEAKTLLGTVGVPTSPCRASDSRAEACRALTDLAGRSR